MSDSVRVRANACPLEEANTSNRKYTPRRFINLLRIGSCTRLASAVDRVHRSARIVTSPERAGLHLMTRRR